MLLSNKRKIGYAINGASEAMATPVDGAIYIFGTDNPVWNTSSGPRRIPIPKAGRIKNVVLLWYANGVAGSNENISVYVRLNSSTDTLVETIGSTSGVKTFNNSALDIAVVDGDFIEIKMVCPTWATNPADVTINFCIYIE